MGKTYTNSGKSVKERLLNLSKEEHYNPQMMISRYMQERLLYRLSISNYRERFILKGGALLYAHDRFEARPTLDIDFMATRINNDKKNIKRIIKEICNVDCVPDGSSYDADTVEAEDITVNKEYHGVRVSVVAHLDTARQRVSMDIGFGDVVTPAPQELAFPALIDTVPQAEIKAYSLETVVAEKFHAMIVLSLANSRMKDFFDVYRILVTDKVDDEILPEAIRFTFANRGTGYRENHPLFTEEFFASKDRQSFWKGFLRKIKYSEIIEFQTVGLLIKDRLQPYWESLRDDSIL
ncbi:nucleotidyl transferase AbiEii/AbiGii toxin family protein [Phocaeicola barnesiae]|uniref:nucleotidyl transferase AbiEii/AbiGii toxin family protein n=1 Tax=Phocaeicola barnesiae TaxID=376804 RepID=UPI00241D910D|nr:nucleotidyl transferase AbiEii/AbiGii toxin family protein [Phocaeicola barnesiae]